MTSMAQMARRASQQKMAAWLRSREGKDAQWLEVRRIFSEPEKRYSRTD